MKRIISFLFFTYLTSCVLMAQEAKVNQKQESEPATEETGSNFWKNWSASGRLGISAFDGDVAQDYNEIFPKREDQFSIAVSLEKSFNPRYGIVLQYMYLPYKAGKGKKEFSGKMHSPAVLLSVNLSNLFYESRKNAKWDIYAEGGLGLGFYDVKPKTSIDYPNGIKDGRASAFILGLLVEWNFTKRWALSWNNQYNYYTKDNLEAFRHIQGNTNDAIFSSTLGLRYKINSEMSHTRNEDYVSFESKREGSVPNKVVKVEKRVDKVETRMVTLEDKVNVIVEDVAANKKDIATLSGRVDNIDQFIEEQFSTLDSDGDGVPDYRDRHPNTPKGVLVNYWGEPIESVGDLNTPSIFFDFDRSELSARSKEVIKEVAFKMTQDPEIKVEIRGYTDNFGTNDYNVWLSTERALGAKQYLAEKFKIDESRIIANGLGKIPDRDMIDRSLNRRCDFFFDR